MLGAGEACGRPASLPASAPCFPQGQVAGAGLFHWSGSGPLRGRDSRRGASSPKMQGGWCQELGPSGPGAELGNTGCLGGSLQTLPLLKDHPPLSSPSAGTGSSGALGTHKEEGLGAAGTESRAGLGPLLLLRGLHTVALLASCLPSASFLCREQARSSAGSLACMPGRAPVPPSPRSLRSVLGQSGTPERGEGGQV